MSEQVIQQTKQKMQAALEAFERELGSIRTGRAAPSLIENMSVEAYGSHMKLQEVASITAPEPSLLVVQPWDATIAGSIANALRTSDFHFNPIVEGAVIRVPLPPLTQERRQELVKLVSKKAEEAKISIRTIRQDAFARLKRAKEDGDISQDEQLGFEKRIQEVVEGSNRTIDSTAKAKEQDLLKI